jgi:hypothetical protein
MCFAGVSTHCPEDVMARPDAPRRAAPRATKQSPPEGWENGSLRSPRQNEPALSEVEWAAGLGDG